MKRTVASQQIHKEENSTICTAKESLIEQLLAAEALTSRCIDYIALQKNTSSFQTTLWREKIAQWFYDVIDFMNESRTIVHIAMNILDRYCAVKLQKEEIVAEKTYDIVATTAIFLAIRVIGNKNYPSLITDLLRATSSSCFGAKDVLATGKSMVYHLTWGTRLVTPHDFILATLQCLSSKVLEATKKALRESALYLVELTVYDAYFARLKASKVAMAAMLNSTETRIDRDIDEFKICRIEIVAFYDDIAHVKRIDVASEELKSIKCRLNILHNRLDIKEKPHEKLLHCIPDKDCFNEEKQRKQKYNCHEEESLINDIKSAKCNNSSRKYNADNKRDQLRNTS